MCSSAAMKWWTICYSVMDLMNLVNVSARFLFSYHSRGLLRNGRLQAAAESCDSDYLFSNEPKLQQAEPRHRFSALDMNTRLKNHADAETDWCNSELLLF